MIDFIFFSDTPAKLFFGNCGVVVSKISQKRITLDMQKTLCFDLYFLNMEQNVFHKKIVFNGTKFVCDDKFLHLVKIDENLYFVKILTQNDCFFAKKVKKISKNGLFFNFFQNGVIEIENETELLYSEKNDIKIIDATVLQLKNNHYAIKLFGENETEQTVVINNFFVPVLVFDSCVVESIEKGFKVLTNLYDIAGHGIVEVFEIDDDIKKTDEYTVYINGEPNKNKNVNVLPVFFLECIRAKDYTEAKKCLSSSLSQKAKLEHLKAYFGDFIGIDVFNNKIYLEYCDENECYFARQYNFLLKDEKIENID